MLSQYIQKSLIAASSTGIGTLSSASPGVATLNTSQLDTQRRIAIWSTGATLASASFTVAGTREGGGTLKETITGPTSNAAVTTTQDFLSVTSVSASSVIANQAMIGTNTQGGSPWKPANLQIAQQEIGCALTFSSTANSMAASMEFTMDDPTIVSSNTVPGGQVAPFNVVPVSVISTAFSSATGNTWGRLNAVGAATMPIGWWRMTLTSSSSTAGNVNAAVIQAGIG